MVVVIVVEVVVVAAAAVAVTILDLCDREVVSSTPGLSLSSAYYLDGPLICRQVNHLGI